jgi:hypothetical protein
VDIFVDFSLGHLFLDVIAECSCKAVSEFGFQSIQYDKFCIDLVDFVHFRVFEICNPCFGHVFRDVKVSFEEVNGWILSDDYEA